MEQIGIPENMEPIVVSYFQNNAKKLNNMVDKILKGEKVKNIPVKVFKEDLSIYVNKKILGELGITLPDSIKNDKAYIEM